MSDYENISLEVSITGLIKDQLDKVNEDIKMWEGTISALQKSIDKEKENIAFAQAVKRAYEELLEKQR